MARFRVQCDTCGSDMDFNTFGGNSRDKQWRADHFNHECDECKQKRIGLENAKNAEKNREEGLPALVGSEKQIAWAETLRANVLSLVDSKRDIVLQQYAEEILEEIEDDALIEKLESLSREDLKIEFEKMFDYAFSIFIKNEKASYWIDKRDSRNGMEIYSIIDILVAIPFENIAMQKDVELQLQKEAELEATVRPEIALSETIAYIFMDSDEKLCIEFPEKREDFRTLVKAHGFRWGKGRWYRNLSIITGTKEDRIAEMGNLLLTEGFVVRIFDEEIRQRAIEGIYGPEHTRWIQYYKGKFSIRWSRGSEDFYAEARKIPTSKWDNPTVDVKSEQFEAVEDFANEYDFRFTPKALELSEEARATKEAQLIPTIKKGKASTKAPIAEKDFTIREEQIDESLWD